MNALKLCMSGILLSMSGCASWDWDSAAAYTASPQYQAYATQQLQQYSLDQQLANQRYATFNQRLLQMGTDNANAMQRINSEQQREARIMSRLDDIENSINRQSRSGNQWYR